jgi:hypothetical protein
MAPHRLQVIFALGGIALAAACGSTSSSSSDDRQGGGDDASTVGGSVHDASSGSLPSSSDSGGPSASSGSGGGSGSPAASGASTSSGSSSGSGSPDSGTTADAGTIWHPQASAPIHFHWMIGANFGSSDILSGQAGQVVYDIDGAGASKADVDAIHAAGAIAVCYVDVGTLENGRPDYSDFPSSVVGPGVQGWPGENWLLVTAANQSVILPLMKARFMNWCQAKGFDAVEPDNLDAWTNISGVSEADNLAYDLAIGQLAHSLSLSVGLKNVMTDVPSSQYAAFLGTFDWALNEQCYEYNECGAYTATGSFLPANKAVFDVEYNVAPNCTQANSAHLNAQKTDLDLVGATDNGYAYAPCIPDSQATW